MELTMEGFIFFKVAYLLYGFTFHLSASCALSAGAVLDISKTSTLPYCVLQEVEIFPLKA
jgi:hypothetical protein